MKIFKIFKGIVVISILMQSCTSSQNATKISEDAESAYKAGNDETALTAYEQIIDSRESKGKSAKGPIYVGAGKSALALEQNEEARKYLEKAKGIGYSSPEMFLSLIKVYNNIDNLSKEMSSLESYRKFYPTGEKINIVNSRLFETYVESENWDLAIELWPSIESQAQSNVELLSGYLTVNKNKENTSICDKLAQQIIKLDGSNIIALEWYAEKYYLKAENLYVSEMKAYKANRTTSQYNRLLKALDEVYPDFRKSRDYYLKLYKIKPNAEYAKYLGNIYTRLDDKEKADYYYNKAK